jgi:hypothetical protein
MVIGPYEGLGLPLRSVKSEVSTGGVARAFAEIRLHARFF